VDAVMDDEVVESVNPSLPPLVLFLFLFLFSKVFFLFLL